MNSWIFLIVLSGVSFAIFCWNFTNSSNGIFAAKSYIRLKSFTAYSFALSFCASSMTTSISIGPRAGNALLEGSPSVPNVCLLCCIPSIACWLNPWDGTGRPPCGGLAAGAAAAAAGAAAAAAAAAGAAAAAAAAGAR